MPYKTFLKYCKNCKVQLKLNNTRDITRKNFCSRSCRSKFHITPEVTKLAQSLANTPESNAKKGNSGSKNPNWVQDRSKLKYQRSKSEHRWWTKKIFERDNYLCQACKIRGKSIQAHHKAPYSLFPKLRDSIDNGITLCVDCHKEVHLAAYEIFKNGGYRMVKNALSL